MKFLSYRYSALAFFITSGVFVFSYAFIVALYSIKIPSLAFIGIGNFIFAIVMFVLRNKNK